MIVSDLTTSDITTLRSDILASGVDFLQADELIRAFITGRGYAISDEEVAKVRATIPDLKRFEEALNSSILYN